MTRTSKIPMDTGRRTIPEAILLEIIARSPLRSIGRFKSVCKTWKSVIESPYFRRLFLSLHKNSSSSWSLMFATRKRHSITEAIGFHGCKTWDLPKSLGSYILPFRQYPNLSALDYYYVASSNGLILIEIFFTRADAANIHKSFVGNPVLQQWVLIPPPPEPCTPTGLVTSVDEDSLVSSFKVVRTCPNSDKGLCEWRVYVYSSETGLWTFKQLLSSIPLHHPGSYPPMNINGMLYLCKKGSYRTGPGVLIAHDFYSTEADDQCQVIPLPLPYNRVSCLTTTSGGDVIYIEILDQRLKVWKLNNNNNYESSECWQLSREDIDMASIGVDGNCIPMAMNPFDTDIIYLWSLEDYCFVSGNLRTNEFIVHEESEYGSTREGFCRINASDSLGYMEDALYLISIVKLSQFVLPRWMDPVPLPPN